MIVRKGARLGSIRHDRVEPEPAPAPGRDRVAGTAVVLGTQMDPGYDPPSVSLASADPAPTTEPPTVDIEQLRADASELGVSVDRRWGAARLQQEIDRRLEDS